MNRFYQIKNRGFTLIELLVVVAIIGILTALLMSNFIGVRQRARDAQRKSDIRQIQSALELYRADQGQYPSAQGSTIGACGTSLTANGVTYMKSIPCDPLNTTSYYNGGSYYYALQGSGYELAACLENTNDKDITPLNSCTQYTGGSSGFVVYNP